MEVDHEHMQKYLMLYPNWNEESHKVLEKIVFMGGFLIIICFLHNTYSQFKKAGLIELLFCGGLGPKDTIANALKGGTVFNCISICLK